MKGFLFGLLLLAVMIVTVFSSRPGGLRRQLRMAGRRLRIALLMGGGYLAGSALIRLLFPTGPVSELGAPTLALVLAVVFLFLAQDPTT